MFVRLIIWTSFCWHIDCCSFHSVRSPSANRGDDGFHWNRSGNFTRSCGGVARWTTGSERRRTLMSAAIPKQKRGCSKLLRSPTGNCPPARSRVNLPFLAAVRGEPKLLEYEPTRSTLERLVRPVIERCCGKVKRAFLKQESSAKLPMRGCSEVWKNDE